MIPKKITYPIIFFMIIAVFSILLPSQVAADSADSKPVLSQDDLILLELILNDWRLKGEFLIAYQIDDRTYLPLAQLFNFLELDFAVDLVEGITEGMIYNQSEKYLLDLNNRKAAADKNEYEFSEDKAASNSSDIYVDSGFLSEWLPIEFEVNTAASILRIKPDRPLPIQLERDRLYRWSNYSDRDSRDEDPLYPAEDNPYQLFAGPFVDQDFKASYKSGKAKTDSVSTDISADILFMTGEFSFSGPSPEELSLSNYKLGRKKPEAELLGPLKAHEFWIGDIRQNSVQDILKSQDLRGLMLSSFPYDRSDHFDSHVFEGELPEGWEVELYSDGELIDFEGSNEEEKYVFEDIPINYGKNEFTLVFYDELEQQVEETEYISISSTQVPPGEQYYRFSYGKAEEKNRKDENKRELFEYAYGLNKNVTLIMDTAEVTESEGSNYFSSLGLTGSYNNINWKSIYLNDHTGGSGIVFDFNTSILNTRVNADFSYFNDFESPEVSDLKYRSNLELRRSFSLVSSLNIYSVLDIKQRDSDWDYQLTNRFFNSFSLADFRFRNRLNFNLSESSSSSSGELRMTKRFSDYYLGALLDYEFNPWESNDLSLNIRGPINYLNKKEEGSEYYFELNSSYDLEDKGSKYSAAINKERENSLHSFALSYSRDEFSAEFSTDQEGTKAGIELSYFDADDYQLSFELSKSFGFDHNGKRHNTVGSADAAASLEVYIDQGKEKIPLEDIGVKINDVKTDYRTDSEGNLLIPLEADHKTDIALDIDTLKNPFLIPEKEGVSFTPRQGQPYKLEIPLLLAGELTGQVYINEGKEPTALIGSEVQLVDKDNQTAAAASTSFDGFFYLQEIPPGEYLLKLSEEELQRRGLKQLNIETIKVSREGGYVGDFEIILERDD